MSDEGQQIVNSLLWATNSYAETFVTAVDEQYSSLQSNIHPSVKVLHTRHFSVDFEAKFLCTAIFFNDRTDQNPDTQVSK